MNIEYALELIGDRNFLQLKLQMAEMNPYDIASLITNLSDCDGFSEKDLLITYRILPKELAADVFSYMDSDEQLVLINAFSDREIRDVLDELYIDDAVDIIEEMPANVVSKILKNTDNDTRNQINTLLNYPKDSAGSVMTTEFVYLKKELTVKEAFDKIRKIGLAKETVYNCYVTDNRKLIGVITLLDMLVADYETKIEEIMETNVKSVHTHDDQENAALMLSKYDLAVIPVVDGEDRIVGILTFDDAMDVIRDENTEDIEKMAAIIPSERPYMKTSSIQIWKQRVPWLIFLMLSATFTGMILSSFEEALSILPALTIFVPMIMGTAGNSGNQASVTVTRGISLGEIEFRDIFKVVFKEFRVGILCSITISALVFLKVIFIDRQNVPISLAVSLTMFCAVLFSKIVGCTLPLFAKKIKLDPAVMASPFITTIIDVISLLIYFTIASNILNL